MTRNMTSGTLEKEAAKRPIPKTMGMGTSGLEPLLRIWSDKNPDVPWSIMIRRAVRAHLAPLAGKKLAHLVNERAA